MNMGQIFLEGGLTILIYVSVIWVISLIKKDAGIMDIFWSLGFIVTGYVYLLAGDSQALQPRLLYALILFWGLRLSIHIGVRNLGEVEDARYANWRKQFGAKWWWLSYFRVFILQGVVMWIVSLPLLIGLQDTSALNLLDWVGILLFIFGFLFEAIGDWQLRSFKKDPNNKGKVLDTGLWSLTRHPNYFGEALLWWGLSLIAVQMNTLWILISPAIMTWLLIKVSGVAMLDDLLRKTKPAYADYIENTNAFFPGKRK